MMALATLAGLICLTIIALAVSYWRCARRAQASAAATGDEAEAERLSRVALVVTSLMALALYLMAGSPLLAVFKAGEALSERDLHSNIVVLESYIASRWPSLPIEPDGEFARAQYHLAEQHIMFGNYLKAKSLLGQLLSLWPENEEIARHYASALALASLQASANSESEKAAEMRQELSALIDRRPHLRETVRGIFGAFLRSRGHPPGGEGAPAADAAAAGDGAPSPLRLELRYHDSEGISPQAVLFISVHDPKAPAGSMPLAAQRHSHQPFPGSVEIGAADMLVGGVRLGEYEELEIRARIAQSGAMQRLNNDIIAAMLIQPGAGPGPWRIDIAETVED